MTSPLHRYSSHKPSGVGWLSDVPAHWDVRRLKHVASYRASNVDKRTQDEETRVRLCNYTDVYYGDRIRVSEGEFMEATASLGEIDRFGLHVGDVVITKDSEDWQDIAVPALIDETAADFVCGYHLGIIRAGPAMDAVFLYHAIQSGAINRQFQIAAAGVTRYGLPNAAVGDALLPLPPLPEQRAIAHYLDHVDQRIQRYVSAKRRLIDLLEEERQAVVTQALTRGLDPDVGLKPSGVEWLGDVPEHWEVRRLGYLATKFGSGITPRGGAAVYQSSGVPFLRSQNIHFDGLRLQDVARIHPSLHAELAGSHVKPGDVLLNITGASIGRSCSVPEDVTEANVNQHVCIIRPRRTHLHPNLLAAYLATPMMQRKIQLEQSGASREGLTLQSIRNFKVVVPPLHEQEAIVEYLDTATTHIDAAITRARGQIELIEEYRTRLGADVVTGKVDVRKAADLLPDQEVGDDWLENGAPADFPDGDGGIPEAPVEGLAIEGEVAR